MKKLYIVVPCFNEEEVLPSTAEILRKKLNTLNLEGMISSESRILFVDDGSKDHTWQIIESLHEKDKIFSGVKLSRNRGHQNALIGGLTVACEQADMMITIDADLQDDVDAIDEMVEKFNEGCEIVYGVRSARKNDTFFKRFTAESYYKFLKIMGVDIIYNHADFRLMGQRAVKAMLEFSEVNLFLRGIVPQIGYKWSTVEYERKERTAGVSKYPLRKMLSLAGDGITSFSVKPLKIITRLGFLACLMAIVFLIYSVIRHAAGHTVDGWTSLIVSIWFIGGVQLVCIGVLGEYIGKIYVETKHRPKFFLEKILDE